MLPLKAGDKAELEDIAPLLVVAALKVGLSGIVVTTLARLL